MDFKLITDAEPAQIVAVGANIQYAARYAVLRDLLNPQGVRLRLMRKLPRFAAKNGIAPLMKAAEKKAEKK